MITFPELYHLQKTKTLTTFWMKKTQLRRHYLQIVVFQGKKFPNNIGPMLNKTISLPIF